MKIRTGFVSNSSSSSFVVAGFLIPEQLMESIEESTDRSILRTLFWEGGSDSDVERGMFLIGSQIARITDEDPIDFTSISLAELAATKEKLITDIPALKEFADSFAVFAGTRMC